MTIYVCIRKSLLKSPLMLAANTSVTFEVGKSPFYYSDQVCGGLPQPTNTKIQILDKESDDDISKIHF
jgi:hypothetical protein